MIPATILPPLLILVIVRAMAPVAGMPPNNGVIRLAVPCSISSVFESSLYTPVTPSATVADSNDSIAPNTAIVMATGNKSLMASQLRVGMAALGNSDLMVKRSPMVSMESMPAYVFNTYTPIVTTIIAIREPGIFFRKPRSNGNNDDAENTYDGVPPVDCVEMPEIDHPFSDKVSGTFSTTEIQSEYVSNLGCENSDGYTAGKAYNNQIGNKLNNRSQFKYSQ